MRSRCVRWVGGLTNHICFMHGARTWWADRPGCPMDPAPPADRPTTPQCELCAFSCWVNARCIRAISTYGILVITDYIPPLTLHTPPRGSQEHIEQGGQLRIRVGCTSTLQCLRRVSLNHGSSSSHNPVHHLQRWRDAITRDEGHL
jgi:hypothetical protein